MISSFWRSRKQCVHLLSLCATSADSFSRNTEADGRINRHLPECYQLAMVPSHVDHYIPEEDRRFQEQTTQAPLSVSALWYHLCHADLRVFAQL
jgi:hypothetical protein